MNEQRVAVVTGVAGYWGGRVARELLKEPGWRVIGLDDHPPEPKIEDLDCVLARLDNPALVDLLKAEAADVVCHLDFVEDGDRSEATFEHNVMDTVKLFGACADAGVGRIVLRSSTMVYGAQAENSAFLREEQPLHASKRYGYIRDLVELEAFCENFRRQAPQVDLAVLRCAHIVGPTADTPLMRFLHDERAICLLGFDPIMQVIHEDDVVEALAQAVTGRAAGIFNVGAKPLMPLWRVMALVGKTPIPVLHPLAQLFVASMGAQYAPLELDYLRYRCVGDVARMRDEFGFTPAHAADDALRELGPRQRGGLETSAPDERTPDERQLRDTIARRLARRSPKAARLAATAKAATVPRRRRAGVKRAAGTGATRTHATANGRDQSTRRKGGHHG